MSDTKRKRSSLKHSNIADVNTIMDYKPKSLHWDLNPIEESDKEKIETPKVNMKIEFEVDTETGNIRKNNKKQ